MYTWKLLNENPSGCRQKPVVCICNPSDERQREEDPWRSLASQSSWIGNLQTDEKLSLKNNVNGTWRGTRFVFVLWPLYYVHKFSFATTHIYIQLHTRTHTHTTKLLHSKRSNEQSKSDYRWKCLYKPITVCNEYTTTKQTTKCWILSIKLKASSPMSVDHSTCTAKEVISNDKQRLQSYCLVLKHRQTPKQPLLSWKFFAFSVKYRGCWPPVSSWGSEFLFKAVDDNIKTTAVSHLLRPLGQLAWSMYNVHILNGGYLKNYIA